MIRKTFTCERKFWRGSLLMESALIGYLAFTTGVLLVCAGMYVWADPLERWIRKKFHM